MPLYKGAAQKLDDYDLPRIGEQIGVGEDVLHAFLEVETRGTGFDKHGRVIMLFEPHIFHRQLAGTERDRAVAEGIAYPKWRKPYPADSYPRFEKAVAINEAAAYNSCSWGLGQIMGFNSADAGYSSATEMVTAFADNEDNQLQATVNFIKKAGIADDLRRLEEIIKSGRVPTPQECIPVVRVYNGAGFADNDYHTRFSKAIAKWMRIKDTPYGKGLPVKEMALVENSEFEFTSGMIEASVEGQAVPENLKPETEPIPTSAPTTKDGEPTVFTPAPNEVLKSTPEEKEKTEHIPAIPPLPSRVPEFVKRLFKIGATVTGVGITGPFIFLRDNPNLLAPILGFFKWMGIGLAIAIGLYVILQQVDKMWKAYLANQLNIARLQNYGDENTKNIDFRGWKGVPEGEQPKV